MKKLFYMISVAAFMASFASCGKLEQENTPADKPVVENPSADGTTTLTISAGLPQTKTFWDQDNNLVKWSSGDIVTVLAQGVSAKSSSSIGMVETENFTVANWPVDVTPQYAVFAGPDNSVYDDYKPVLQEDGKVAVILRNKQEIFNRGSFGKVANLSIGELVAGENGVYSTMMKNVCGLIKFQITENAYSVKIEDADGGALAGGAVIMMEDGIPVVTENRSSASSVTITSRVSSDSGLLIPGRSYMACVYPGEYTPKITIKASENDENPIVVIAKSKVQIKRNEIMDFGKFDNTPVTPPTPGEGEGEEGGDDPVTPPTSDEVVLTLDFSSWPFTEKVVSSKTVTEADGNKYTLSQDGAEYKFVIVNTSANSSKGFYWRSASLGIQVNDSVSGTGDFTLSLPVIPDMKFTAASVSVANSESNKKFIKILNADKKQIYGENVHSGNSPYTFEIESPVVGSAYYISTGGKNAQITKIVLTYKK